MANRHAPIGIGDGFFYHHAGRFIADGGGYVDPIRASIGDLRATALHPPLWPSVLAVPSALGLDGELAHRLTGCLVGTGTVAVTGLLGRAVAGSRVGLLAAGATAVHPTLLAADGSLHAETLFGLFATLALLAAVLAARDADLRLAAAAGAAAALAALTRGEGLVLGALLALTLATLLGGTLRWRAPAALLLTMGVLLVPWTARNALVMDEPVLLSTNDATVLAGANCDPTYYGPDIGTWHVECIRALPLEVNEVERSAAWRHDGLDYAQEHLGRVPYVAAAGVARTWGLWRPLSQEIVEGRSPGLQHAGIVIHVVVVLPLALLGAWWARARARVPARWLAVPIVTVTLTAALAFGTLRFRHGAEPVLMVLTAIALATLWERARRGAQ